MDWNAEAYLKSLHTKQLMNLRENVIAVNSNNGVWDRDERAYMVDYVPGHLISHNQVVAELSTREHVPNAQEAKAARQAKAKQQRNR